ncbi:MAG: arsinothricin resistance N-acetyltransferase ArsN1 family B [Longimicrobiales bacterium]
MNVIRLSTIADAEQVQAIYAPIVRDTVISFELEPPSVDEMAARMEKTRLLEMPWIVIEDAGEVLGYAYAGKYRERPAYHWAVEVSVYVHERARGAGIGRAAYTALFSVLAFQHYQTACAGATLPNDESVRLHEKLAFKTVGVFPNVGYKFGKWHDTIWWAKKLGAHAVPAPETVPLSVAVTMPDFPVASA